MATVMSELERYTCKGELEPHPLGECVLTCDAQAALRDWEEREAAICPEDVGFQEFIRVLQSQLAQSRLECQQARELLAAYRQSCYSHGDCVPATADYPVDYRCEACRRTDLILAPVKEPQQ
jgi:hypothetical protein